MRQLNRWSHNKTIMHFVRHGQSHFNLGYQQQGFDPQTPDAALTPRGFEQAENVARRLADQNVRTIISSPYTRALQTSAAISDHLKIPVHVEPLAGERCLYSCDIGTPTSVLRNQWTTLDFSKLEEFWWPQEHESHASCLQRTVAFKKKWAPNASSGGFVLVSHWYFLNTLLGHDFDNCEILFKPIFSDKHKSLL
jgi:broad specificity phosphatase PhoE